MFRKEPQGDQNARISERIEEMQARYENGPNKRENLCISCIIGTTLGISALAILYLAVMTAAAYAIP